MDFNYKTTQLLYFYAVVFWKSNTVSLFKKIELDRNYETFYACADSERD